MTQSVMLSLLNRASNGNQMLAILDSFVTNSDKDADIAGGYADATLDYIEF